MKEHGELTDDAFVTMLREYDGRILAIDEDNSYMNIKKQYKRLSQKPIHKGTQDKIKEWLERGQTLVTYESRTFS